MNTSIDNKVSNSLYVLRAFAIGCVVFAHCGTVDDATLEISYFCSNYIRSLFTACGVSTFMILSGFFFFFETNPFRQFVFKKIKNLVFPWILTGIIVYLYEALRKGGDIIEGIAFVFGYGSYLWYMTVLFALYIIFFFGRKSKWFLRVIPFVSIASYILNPLFYSVVDIREIRYLNFVNWALFFWMGFILAKYGLLERLIIHMKKYGIIYLFIYFLCIAAKLCFSLDINYWCIYYAPYTLIAFPVFLWLSYLIRDCVFLVDVGKDSFCIYLIHLPVAGVLNAVFQKVAFIWPLVFACPIIVVVICEAFIWVYKKIANKLPEKISKIMKMCIGLR